MDSKLVFKGDTPHVVTFPRFPVGVQDELRHYKKRDALDSVRRIRGAGKHQVDNIFREVVLTVCDVNLLSTQQIMAFVTRDSTRTYRSQIRPCLGFGEIHGPSPFSRNHRRQVLVFLFITAFEEDRLRRGLRQHGTQSKRHICPIPHLLDGTGECPRQTLPPVFRIKRQACPPCFTELGIRLSPGF